MTTDVLIIGQGIAGSALAWRLFEHGANAIVIDRGGPSASRIAAGLMTPITGKRLTLSPRWPLLHASATAFYRSIERATGASLLHAKPALRVLSSAEEQETLLRRLNDQEFAQHAVLAQPTELPATLATEWGGFWMPTATRLDTAAFLQSTRHWLSKRGAFHHADIAFPSDITLTTDGVSVPSLGINARRVVLCTGYASSEAPFATPPLEPVKGEVLTISAPGLELQHVTHRGIWLAPDLSGLPDRYLLGATYDHNDLDNQPTIAGREELIAGLANLTPVPARVINHAAAVRPATSNRQPIAYASETDPRIAWFNGLGAKGALAAPWHANQLAHELRSPPSS